MFMIICCVSGECLLCEVVNIRHSDTPSKRNKMQKSIWNVTSEVLKYNAVRPDHPVKIVDNAIQFLKQKYKVSKW